MGHSQRGYALFIVLAVMTILFIYTSSFSLKVASDMRNAFSIAHEAEASAAADSGLQYGLEAIRQGAALPLDSNQAPWNPLPSENSSAQNICFKIFSNGTDAKNDQVIQAWGEVMKGACRDSSGVSEILAARKLQGAVDPASQKLTQWREVLP